METQKLHRGRLVDHIQIVSRDLQASRRFYEAVMNVLGIPLGGSGPEYFWYDELFISSTKMEPGVDTPTGPMHLAFQAANPEQVQKFHRAGLEAGGKDDGAPGERARYHPGYYAAFLLDPDGNFLEAVYHGEGKRTSPSVEITF